MPPRSKRGVRRSSSFRARSQRRRSRRNTKKRSARRRAPARSLRYRALYERTYGINFHVYVGDDEHIASVVTTLLKPDESGSIQNTPKQMWYSNFSVTSPHLSYESNPDVHNTLAMLFDKGMENIHEKGEETIKVYETNVATGHADSEPKIQRFTGRIVFNLYSNEQLSPEKKLETARQYVGLFLGGIQDFVEGELSTTELYQSYHGNLMQDHLQKIVIASLLHTTDASTPNPGLGTLEELA